MNHFEAPLMISLITVGSKVLRMAIQFDCFFRQKGKMANVMLEILQSFSLMSADVLAFKIQFEIHSKEKPAKIYNITFTICLFLTRIL